MRLVAWILYVALLAGVGVSTVVHAADSSTGFTFTSDPISLLSTFGFPTVAVVALVREIVVPVGRLADAKAMRDEAIAGWKAQTDATNRLASAIEERNKIEAAREHAR